MALQNSTFNILPPVSIVEAGLVSGPPSAERQVYDAGTTYAAGDLVWYDGNVWESDSDGNIGNTPGVAEWTDWGEVDLGAFAWDALEDYSEDDFVVYQDSLWVSVIAGIDSNTGNAPSVTGSAWARQGAVNRHKAFDGFLQDAATGTGSLGWSVSVTNLITDIAIFRANGASVEVRMTDDVEGVVYEENFSIIDNTAVVDWFTFFFSPIVQTDSVLVENLPPYAGAQIDVSITVDEDADVSVGQIVLGNSLSLGVVKVGTSVGIESYSIKERDDFNRSLVVARPYSDTVDFDIAINTRDVGFFKRRLAARDALATVYYMSGGESFGAVAYGFYQNFDILHSNTVFADCVLQIEGLG